MKLVGPKKVMTWLPVLIKCISLIKQCRWHSCLAITPRGDADLLRETNHICCVTTVQRSSLDAPLVSSRCAGSASSLCFLFGLSLFFLYLLPSSLCAEPVVVFCMSTVVSTIRRCSVMSYNIIFKWRTKSNQLWHLREQHLFSLPAPSPLQIPFSEAESGLSHSK